MRRALVLAILAAIAAAPAQAQRLTAGAGVGQLTYRFRDSSGTGQQSGTMLRVGGALQIQRFRFSAAGMFGEVRDAEGDFVPRSLRITTFSAGALATDWLELGLEAQARHETREVGTTLQRLGGPFARAVADFGGTGLEGLAELAIYPLTSSANTPELTTALRAAVGARYSPGGGPFMMQLSYRFTRMDYQESGSGPAPLTQDETIALEIALRKF